MVHGGEFGNHESVNHSIGEYVRGGAHTNTIEGQWSELERPTVARLAHVLGLRPHIELIEAKSNRKQAEASG